MATANGCTPSSEVETSDRRGGFALVNAVDPATNKLLHVLTMVENLGGQIDHPDVLNERVILGTFPRKWVNREAAFCRTIAFKDL